MLLNSIYAYNYILDDIKEQYKDIDIIRNAIDRCKKEIKANKKKIKKFLYITSKIQLLKMILRLEILGEMYSEYKDNKAFKYYINRFTLQPEIDSLIKNNNTYYPRKRFNTFKENMRILSCYLLPSYSKTKFKERARNIILYTLDYFEKNNKEELEAH